MLMSLVYRRRIWAALFGLGICASALAGSPWQSVSPAGETTCSDGTPYRFFVRQANPDKLLVYLQGGGACWSRQTCDPAGRPTYTVNIPDQFEPPPTGIFNFQNTANPFQDYTVVMAPYCTGDVHLGAQTTTYPGLKPDDAPLVVQHQGRANVQAALDWAYANVTAPQEVFVTGSSAGAIPSPYYTVLLADHYSDAKVAQLGDGAGGYRQINDNVRPDAQWGTFNFLNATPAFADVAVAGFNFEKLYIAAAKAHPEILFAQYDNAEDRVQKDFLRLSGSNTPSLLAALDANHADIRAEVDNFVSYIAGGDPHTILRSPNVYRWSADGVRFSDWLAKLAARERPADVRCKQCAQVQIAGLANNPAVANLWAQWQADTEYVEPFKIFDNLYYVGIGWVAAYVIETSNGLILLDSLYGKWYPVLLDNMRKLGLDPADVRYVINTHGHFDHAGGSTYLQHQYGSRVVMAAEDWALVREPPELPVFYAPAPRPDIVAQDGDQIVLGDTTVTLYKTPGHTEGVLSAIYPVRDGDDIHQAITLGGVGLNFSGVARTQTYIESYKRLLALTETVSVNLPNHAFMGGVFENRDALATRGEQQPHPFVNAAELRNRLQAFIGGAQDKLLAEQRGQAADPLDALQGTVED